MKKILFALLAAAVALSSCQDDDGNANGNEPKPGPGEEVETSQALDDLKANTLVMNGEETPFAKIFVDEYSGYIMVTATTNAEAESFDWLVDHNAEYVQLLAMPSLFNREFDVMTESDSFSLFSTYEAAPIVDGVAPGVTEALESGRARFDFDGTNAEIFLDLKLADGHTISARAAGTYAGEAVEENYIECNGDKKPLRASFYSIEYGMGLFYFTPADVDYAEEMFNLATYYVVLSVDESLINGQTVDLSEPSSKYYEIYYVDNMTGNMLYFTSDDTAGATGSFSIKQLDTPSSFAAELSVNFPEGFSEEFPEAVSVALSFEGESKDMYAEPEKANEFTYEGETMPIESVVVDTSSETWTVWLSTQSGVDTVEAMQSADAVKITAPEEAFSGEGVGFSTYKTMSFAYDGQEWNYASGALGTLTATLDGTTLTIDFTNYDNLKGYFNGEAVVVK